jgi:hypothetical protein
MKSKDHIFDETIKCNVYVPWLCQDESLQYIACTLPERRQVFIRGFTIKQSLITAAKLNTCSIQLS